MLAFLRKDTILTLLFMNAFLVIFGYALAVATGMASVGTMKVLKTGVLLGSTFWVFSQKDWRTALKATKHTTLITGLCLILPAFAFISNDILSSLNRTQTFLIPFVYIWLSVSLLVYRYGQREVLGMFSQMILIVYALPMLSYLVFGGGFSGDSIYGKKEGLVFISNHFGWSACLFLIALFHSGISENNNRFRKILLIPFSLLAIYLLIVSANRASLLAVAIAIVVVLFYYKGVSLFQKTLIVFAPVILISLLVTSGNDAVMFVIERSERQQKAGSEPRLDRVIQIRKHIREDPAVLFTGAGLFDYSAFEDKGKGLGGYHNSYFELLFGLGLPLFLLFMVFMLYEPLRQFVKRVSRYDLVFIPLAIIPFFEGNLTAGQFLFFPWFSYIIALNTKSKFALFGIRNWRYYVRSNKPDPPTTEKEYTLLIPSK